MKKESSNLKSQLDILTLCRKNRFSIKCEIQAIIRMKNIFKYLEQNVG